MTLRIVFMGTPDFACPALAALLDAGHEIALTVTQPDKPSGRKLELTPPPVKQLALARGLAVHQPKGVRKAHNLAPIVAAQPDVIVVAAYGKILGAELLELPRFGCINVHASLLPRWRGAAPIQYALLAGDAEAGVTIMQMSAGLDEGDMLLARRVPVEPTDTGGTLHDKLAALGAEAIVAALEKLERGELKPTPQPVEGVTFAPPIHKEDGVLDFSRPAVELERKVRAFDPWPGTYTFLGGERLRIIRAHAATSPPDPFAPLPLSPSPLHAERGNDLQRAGPVSPSPRHMERGEGGEVVAVAEGALVVQTGDGVLMITAVQRPGKKALDAGAFLRGCPVAPGARLGDGAREAGR